MMMKKKQAIYWRHFFAVVMIGLFLTGCTKADKYAQLKEEDKQLVVTQEREKPFGEFEYVDITQEEGLDLMEDKFDLPLPDYYSQMDQFVQKYFETKTIQQGKTHSVLYANVNTLNFRTIYTFYKEKELALAFIVDLDYSFSADEKIALLEKQAFNLKIAPVDGSLPQDNFDELIYGLAEVMKIDGIDSYLAGYKKQITGVEEQLGNQRIRLFDNAEKKEKNKELSKEIVVIYDSGSTFREINAIIQDDIVVEK